MSFINPIFLILDYPFVCYFNFYRRIKDENKLSSRGEVFSFMLYMIGVGAVDNIITNSSHFGIWLFTGIYLGLRFYVFGKVDKIADTYSGLNKLLKNV